VCLTYANYTRCVPGLAKCIDISIHIRTQNVFICIFLCLSEWRTIFMSYIRKLHKMWCPGASKVRV